MNRVAAIDCGTNSIRLLIAEPDGSGGLKDLERRLEVVRLPGWTPRPAARAAARPWTKPKNAPLPSLPAGAAAAARPTVDP